jgi:hypothetical protein
MSASHDEHGPHYPSCAIESGKLKFDHLANYPQPNFRQFNFAHNKHNLHNCKQPHSKNTNIQSTG